MKTNFKGILVAAVILLMVIAVGLVFVLSNSATEKNYSDLLRDLNSDKVTEIYISNDKAEYKLKDDNKTYVAVIRDQQLSEIINDKISVDGSTFKVEYNDRYAATIMDYLPYVVMAVAIGAVIFFVFRFINRQDKQVMTFSKSKISAPSNIKVRFADVAGAEEEKDELKEIVDFLKSPARFSEIGARIPKGVLLVGPPGTGKTLFAKAVAGEAGVPFFSISGSDFVEMYVGVGASRVRDLFDNAKRSMPCIVFIDEIDAVGRKRGAGMGGGHDEREQTLNQLLVQMDGFETNEGIIIMAATNRVDILDPALLRPGRFDRQIYVNIPDVRGREAIFKVHSRNKPMDEDVDFQLVARITSGFSGADIENLLNEAAILCVRAGRKKIKMEDLNEGINKVIMGPQKKSRLVTEVDKRITAYHEAGHAIVAKSSKYCNPVHEVSIIPRGPAGGYTMTRPENDNDNYSVKWFKGEMVMLLGGRAAEEIIIEDITAGASSDIKRVTSIARKMVTEWGMSEEIGPIFYGGDQEVFLGRDYGSTHQYSEQVAAKIDAEVTKLIDEAHKAAVEILENNRAAMETMVRVLIECETIYSEEVDMIMAGKSADEVKEFIKNKTKKS